MEQKNNQTNILSKEEENEYNSLVKDSIVDGSFFEDSKNWYYFRYLSPLYHRANLIISLIFLLIVISMLKLMSDSIFPLVVKQPIFVPTNDRNLSDAKIVKLRYKKGENNYDPEVTTFDDSIIKYLIMNYVKDREEFDFSRGSVEDVNKKFNKIKSNSNFREYKNFQYFMSKENKNSPINFFGKNVKRKIFNETIKFYRRPPKNFGEKVLFFIANIIPLEAEVRFDAELINIDEYGTKKSTYESFLVKIKYEYQPIFKNDKNDKINFSVNQYILYKIKNI